MGIILLISNTLSSFFFSRSMYNKDFTKFLLSIWIIATGQMVLYSIVVSLFNLLNVYSLLILQLIGLGISLLLYIKYKKPVDFNLVSKIKDIKSNKYIFYFLIIVGIFFIYNLLIAILLPPRNWDGLSYHIPRIYHWLQNGEVGHYFTNEWRQTQFPPNSSILMMWTVLTTKSDCFMQVVQWFSALFSCIGIYGLSRTAGLTRVSSSFGAAIFYTLPMVTLQSSTVQNDLVVTSFTLSFVYFLVNYIKKKSTNDLMLAAVSLGMAVGTKYTLVFLIPGIGILLLLIYLENKDSFNKQLLIKTFISLIIGTLVFGSYNYVLNYLDYSNPIGNNKEVNQQIKEGFITQNALKTVFQLVDFTGFPTPFSTYIADSQSHIEKTVYRIAEVEKTAIENRIRKGDNPYWYVSPPHEDYAAFGIIGILILILSIIKGHKNKLIFGYMLSGLVWWIFFAILISYTPFKTRYYILPISFFCICIGVWANDTKKIYKFIYKSMIVLSIYTLIYVSFFGVNKNIISAFQQDRYDIMINRTTEKDKFAYNFISEVVKDYTNVALQIPPDSLEYLIWKTVKPNRLIYAPTNFSVKENLETYNVDYMIAKGEKHSKGNWLVIPGTDWRIASNDFNSSDLFMWMAKNNKVDQLIKLINDIEKGKITLRSEEIEQLLSAILALDVDSKSRIIESIFNTSNQGTIDLNWNSVLINGFYTDGWSKDTIDLSAPLNLILDKLTDTKYISLNIKVKNCNPKDYMVKAFLNNKLIFETTDSNKDISFIIPTNELNKRPLNSIIIKTNTFIPQKEGKSMDNRQLGIIVDKITINTELNIDSPIVDLTPGKASWTGVYSDGWTSSIAQIKLPDYYFKDFKKAKLVIETDMYYLQNFNFKVSLNEDLLMKWDKPRNKMEVNLDFDKVKLDNINKLILHSNTFIPMQVNKDSTDSRELGIRIKKVLLERIK